jgi:hypothetical protein
VPSIADKIELGPRNYKADAATGVVQKYVHPTVTTKQAILEFEQALVEEWARAFPEQ